MRQRIFHKRYCAEHKQDEVCLCSRGEDHPERQTTVSRSQQAQARWSERVNRAHRAAWVHERNVRAWTRVYGVRIAGANAFVGTYAYAQAPGARAALEGFFTSIDIASSDELALMDPLSVGWPE